MKRILLILLSIGWLTVCSSLPICAQKPSVKLDISSAESKYKLHFTDETKVVNMKQDVTAIAYSNGWFFVYNASYVDIYDSSFNLCYTKQDRDKWRTPYVDHDIVMLGNGQIWNIRENIIIGQLEDYLAYSDLTDGVGWVKREERDNYDGCRYYIYDLFTVTGAPLGDTPIMDSRFPHDLKKPLPLVDGRRAVYIHETQQWAYLDEAGNQAILTTYAGAHSFSEGLAAVKKEIDGEYKWGFINPQGEEVIPFKFTKEPGDFHDGVAVVTKLNGKKTYLKKDGTTLKVEVDFLLPRWNNHTVWGDLNPTYTIILTPTKDIEIKNLSLSTCGYDTDCPIPFIVESYGGPVISFEGDLLYKRKPGFYLADGFWWDNKRKGYSAVVFSTDGKVLIAFKTVPDEF